MNPDSTSFSRYDASRSFNASRPVLALMKMGCPIAPTSGKVSSPCHRHSHRRVWLLVRLGRHGYVVEGVVLSLVRQAVFPPRLHDYFQCLQEAGTALGIGHVVALVVLGQPAAADSKIESSLC